MRLLALLLVVLLGCGGAAVDVTGEKTGPGIEETSVEWWCLELICLTDCNEDPRDLTFEPCSTHQLGLAYFRCTEEEALQRLQDGYEVVPVYP